MTKFIKIAFATAAAVALPATAWAMGTLSISSASKISTSTGDSLIVSYTCVKGAGKVKIWAHDTTTLAQTKIHTSRKDCGKLSATSGVTVSVPVNSLPAGTYHVMLRQDGVQSAPSAPITLP